ncbi:MAG: ribosome biogenesis GTP-binding protein YihA/YsxC [Candidatus Cloacimonadota bacterium]|nr:ribosome biogenesis GTP-binding protein YihA/YsxC [Candidatus Cloacimonadota bacterium]
MLEILNSEFVKSAVKPQQYPATPFTEIAFAGKSNVGKSSMINTLLKRKSIAKVSKTPGKTRLLNFFKVHFRQKEKNQQGYFMLADLPGYGYAKVSKKERSSWQLMMQQYFVNRLNLKIVILLVDIRHKADPKDMLMLEMLHQTKQNFMVVATKADKVAKTKRNKAIKDLAVGLQLPKNLIIPFSATQKIGLTQILDVLEKYLFDTEMRL